MISAVQESPAMKQLLIRLPDDVHRKMRMIAVEDDSNLQRIILALIHDFISKRSKAKTTNNQKTTLGDEVNGR